MVAAAIASGWVQHGPIASVDKIMPKLENLSLLKGLGRLFSLRSIVEFAKGVLKMAIVGSVAFALVAPEIDGITASIELEPAALLHFIWIMSLRLMGGVCAIITVIAGIDYRYQQYEFQKSMRMSKQEIKDEHKQTDGDPMIKGRLRQLRLERARKRMMAAVPEADVVITNPTHFAVALKYDTETMDAPMLTAKGADNIAQRMREVAKEYDIPIVENPPLARAIHAGVEVDQHIPETYYRAVAEVIGYVWRLKGKRSKQTKR
jgi:flagellar biosynthetic protein FlhB